MRKFECKECSGNCRLEIEEVGELRLKCVRHYDGIVKWHEVKEENTQQFGNSEQLPSNPRNLPDWVKVGAIGYDESDVGYYEVTAIRDGYIDIIYLEDNETEGGMNYENTWNSKQARKRPFNANEMKALVGKIIQKDNDIGVVMHYFGKDNEVLFCNSFATSEDLMNNNCVIYSTGKPCYVLEHLENGEWVE